MEPNEGRVIFLLVATAFAAEPPPLPEAHPPTANECGEARPVVPGMPLGEAFYDAVWSVEDGPVFSCGGVLVPTSEAAHMLVVEAYAASLFQQYRLDTQDLEGEIAVLQAEVSGLTAPTPWLQSPNGQRWTGRAEATVVFMLATGSVIYISNRLRE